MSRLRGSVVQFRRALVAPAAAVGNPSQPFAIVRAEVALAMPMGMVTFEVSHVGELLSAWQAWLLVTFQQISYRS